MPKQADHDDYDVEDLGVLIEDVLNQALAWRRGEVTLPVHNVPSDYAKRMRAMRKRLGVKSRAAFAEAIGVPKKPSKLGSMGAHPGSPAPAGAARLQNNLYKA